LQTASQIKPAGAGAFITGIDAAEKVRAVEATRA